MPECCLPSGGGTSADQGNHRFAARYLASGLCKARRFVERFHIKQNSLAIDVLPEFPQVLDHAQVHAVADRYHGAQRDTHPVAGIDRFLDDGAGLGNKRHSTAEGHIAEKCRGER